MRHQLNVKALNACAYDDDNEEKSSLRPRRRGRLSREISAADKASAQLWMKVSMQMQALRKGTKMFATRFWEVACANAEGNASTVWEIVLNESTAQRYWDLARVCLSVCQMPCSSSTVERSFSALRHIVSWKRASLGRETIDKLMFVYCNARLKKRRC